MKACGELLVIFGFLLSFIFISTVMTGSINSTGMPYFNFLLNCFMLMILFGMFLYTAGNKRKKKPVNKLIDEAEKIIKKGNK